MSKAIIDGDSYFYRAALTCNELVQLQPGMYYECWDINKARRYLSDLIEELLARTGCSEYVFVTGGVGKNFRYIVNPDYKSNRKKQAKPIMLDKVREMVFDEFPVVYLPCLEADDTCRILMEENKDNVIVSIDKDLRTFPGKIYDSFHDTMRYITKQQAEANFKRQLLIGDKTDGYTGIPKIGPATADKLILDGITIDEVAQKYVECGLGLDYFEMIYNCAKILGKEDYNDGVIKLYGGKTIDIRTIND
jgi:DNA polymerase-1